MNEKHDQLSDEYSVLCLGRCLPASDPVTSVMHQAQTVVQELGVAEDEEWSLQL